MNLPIYRTQLGSPALARLKAKAFNPQPEPPKPLSDRTLDRQSQLRKASLSEVSFNPQPEPPKAHSSRSPLVELLAQLFAKVFNSR